MKVVEFTQGAVPLSAAIAVGDLVFVSGQLAFRDGAIVGETVAEQTEFIFDAFEQTLAKLNLNLGHIVKANVWLVDAAGFADFNRVYAARLGPPYPARSTTVSALVVPGALIEIDIVASTSTARG